MYVYIYVVCINNILYNSNMLYVLVIYFIIYLNDVIKLLYILNYFGLFLIILDYSKMHHNHIYISTLHKHMYLYKIIYDLTQPYITIYNYTLHYKTSYLIILSLLVFN